MTGFEDPAVKAKFAGYPKPQRERLMALRDMTFETAATTPGVGQLTEVLKWGQPSYQTYETNSGTPLRMDAHPAGGVALYVNCQTDLIDQFKLHYPKLAYEGMRAVVMAPDKPIPEGEIRHLIALTLTFHARKKAEKKASTVRPSRSR